MSPYVPSRSTGESRDNLAWNPRGRGKIADTWISTNDSPLALYSSDALTYTVISDPSGNAGATYSTTAPTAIKLPAGYIFAILGTSASPYATTTYDRSPSSWPPTGPLGG